MKSFRERKERAMVRSLEVLSKTRECDGCQACCMVHTIHVLKKPGFTVCPNQCYAGCTVHGADKPVECAEYMCAYRAGMAAERPDKLGLIIDMRYLLRADATRTDEFLVSVWEVWPGAALQNDAWETICLLAEKTPNLILVPFDAPLVAPGVSSNINLKSSGGTQGLGLFEWMSPPAARIWLRENL